MNIFKNKTKFITNDDFRQVSTRHRQDFYIPFRKLNVTKNSPSCLGLKIFNKLPGDIKDCNTLCQFKKRLKFFLLDLCPYSLDEYFG